MPTEESPYESRELQQSSFLDKKGLNKVWSKIDDKFMRPPSGGIAGQALVKTDEGYDWGDVSGDTPEVLPIENGGTGCTTVDGLRTMLFNFPEETDFMAYLGK